MFSTSSPAASCGMSGSRSNTNELHIMELTQEQINNLYEAINGIAGLVLMLKGISNSSVDDEALICRSILTCVIDVRKKNS